MWAKQKQTGFTIVELLIVIIVIGILAAIVITSFRGVQQKARDSERVSDINSMKKQLEALYASKGYYPLTESLPGGQGFPFLAANMPGADPQIMVTPTASDKTLSSYKDFSSPPIANYGYISYKADGSRCSSALGDATTACVRYNLYYRTENPSAVKTLPSLHGY